MGRVSAFSDILSRLGVIESKLDKAPAVPDQSLAANLNATIAALTADRDCAVAKANALLSERDAALASVAALTTERDAAKAEAATLKAEAKTAEARASEILAQAGHAPVPGGSPAASQGKATSIPADAKGLSRVAAALRARKQSA